MKRRILSFLTKPTSKDVVINTLGNYLNVFFTALFALLLVRILTPSSYGVLMVLLSIAYVLANLLEFGTTATIYSYLPPLIEGKNPSIYRFIKSTFFYQSLFSLIALTILIIAFPFLDKVFFKTNAPPEELYLTVISVLMFIWQNFVLNILFAAKRFLKANIYLNISNMIKTAIILYLAATHMVTVGSIIFVFGIIGPLVFFLLLFIEKKDLVFILIKAEVRREEFRFGYTLTYFLASQFFNVGSRMDLFILSYFNLRTEVGYYGLAQKVILTVITTIVSITQVLSPGFSRVSTKKETLREFKTGFMYLLVPSALFCVLFIFPIQLYDIFFTTRYLAAVPIIRALSLPFILYSLSSLPMLFILYTVKKPVYILMANIMFFLIVTVGSYTLIPGMKVFGPPWAIFAAFLVSTAILSIATIKEYRKMK